MITVPAASCQAPFDAARGWPPPRQGRRAGEIGRQQNTREAPIRTARRTPEKRCISPRNNDSINADCRERMPLQPRQCHGTRPRLQSGCHAGGPRCSNTPATSTVRPATNPHESLDDPLFPLHRPRHGDEHDARPDRMADQGRRPAVQQATGQAHHLEALTQYIMRHSGLASRIRVKPAVQQEQADDHNK